MCVHFILAHQFWFSYPPPGAGTSRSQVEDEKKEKKEIADAVARVEQQQKQALLRADQIDRESPRDYKLERHQTPFVGSKSETNTLDCNVSISEFSQSSSDMNIEVDSQCKTSSIQKT